MHDVIMPKIHARVGTEHNIVRRILTGLIIISSTKLQKEHAS